MTIDQATIDQWIIDAARTTPEKTSIVFKDEAISYASFAEQLEHRIRSLQACGIQHGDRIAWYGLNHPEVFTLLFACARLGAILVPLNWRLAEPEIASVVAEAQPAIVFCQNPFHKAASLLPNVSVINIDAQTPDTNTVSNNTAAALQNISIDDPVLLVYTSGSTGHPKGALLTQKALICNAAMSVEAHRMTSSDAVLVSLPLFHVGGLNILPTPAFSVAATILLHERFEPDLACLALQQASLTITVPTVLQAIMSSRYWGEIDRSGIRAISIGSTDVPIALIEEIHALDIPMIQIYGATETSPFAIYQTLEEATSTVGSIGRAGSGCQIRLVADDRDVEDGQPGEIWVKGDNVLREYWCDPVQTEESLIDGWWRTGDVATRDSDGLYWFTDRIKHVIISGGENIYPTEIERILRLIPAIDEVAIVGRPDARWGQIPVAVVVTNRDMNAETLLEHLNGKIAAYKLPKDVVFVDALPRNATGKVVVSLVQELIT